MEEIVVEEDNDASLLAPIDWFVSHPLRLVIWTMEFYCLKRFQTDPNDKSAFKFC